MGMSESWSAQGWEESSSDAHRLLSARELADYLGVPLATVYAWRYRGQGPRGFRAGRYLRYRWYDVEEWITGRIRDGTLE